MRKIIVLEFITLDGVIQAGGAPLEDTSGGFKYGGWQAPFTDQILGEVMDEQMKQPFSLLLGRKTYDIFAEYWPYHETEWPGIDATKKYVVSNNSTLQLDWNNSILISGDVINEIKKLKAQDGPNLHVFGSGNFVQTLMKHDLIDILSLKIYPITLGSGKRLFVDGTMPATFELTDYKVTTTGVIVANYKRAGEIKTGTF